MSYENETLALESTLPLAYAEGLEDRVRDRLRIQQLRSGKRSLLNRLALGFALIGPGVLVMLGDNDAGGVITYAQTGATYGLSLFIPLMVPLAFIAYLVQEMTIRLGAVTRRGHAELIWKRYGRFWGAFSLFDLVAANVQARSIETMAGIIAQLATVLASENISIDAVLQLPNANWRGLPFVITVEPAAEQAVRAAIARMAAMNFLIEPPLAMPMESPL